MIKTVFLLLGILGLSLGRTGFGPTEQEWGYVTVREGAHMFWWLHQTTAPVKHFSERPLVIWLQGGPGSSSAGYGNFAELGPLDENLEPRSFAWTNDYNVLFVDNPVGTGFSYVDHTRHLTITNGEIAQDFVALLQGFYKEVPELRNTDLYIFSESYGGKMTAEIAYAIDKAYKAGDLDVRLKGVGLGDGWVAPLDIVLTWAPYLLAIGAVDQNGYEQVKKAAAAVESAVNVHDWKKATSLWGTAEYVILDVAHDIDFYNILQKIPARSIQKYLRAPIFPGDVNEQSAKIDRIMNNQVKHALNLNVTFGAQKNNVFNYLAEDFMKPATNIVELLLNTTDIKVAVYNGQLDLIVDTPGTVKWVDELNFAGTSNWKYASRKAIVVNNINEGYYKKVGLLSMYWVNRAGHMVPSDNPAAMKFILEEVIE